MVGIYHTTTKQHSPREGSSSWTTWGNSHLLMVGLKSKELIIWTKECFFFVFLLIGLTWP